MDIVVLTGMSGAGRSTAARALEDIGFFVTDNLPPQLLPQVLDIAQPALSQQIATLEGEFRQQWPENRNSGWRSRHDNQNGLGLVSQQKWRVRFLAFLSMVRELPGNDQPNRFSSKPE